MISIHALREEGDPHTRHDTHTRTLFLSTPSARRATALIYPQGGFGPFLSTPSARRATRAGEPFLLLPEISIHALREEGDLVCAAPQRRSSEFLSTPSARRATSTPRFFGGGGGYFYPRPPRGGRQRARTPPRGSAAISIHALREEGDALPSLKSVRPSGFLSTPSARRATSQGVVSHLH